MSKKDDPTPEDLGLAPASVAETPGKDGEPTHTEAPPPEGAAPRRRGRPPGSGKKTDGTSGPKKSESRKQADVQGFAKQLVGIHAIAAMATGLPELAIAETEGEMLAKGLAAVADEYGLELSGKTGAAIQLFGALGMVYIPRAFAIRARAAAAQAARQAEQDNTLDGAGLVYPHHPATH